MPGDLASQDFGIGVRVVRDSSILLLLSQGGMVFDDPVVDHGNASVRSGHMGVRISVGRGAMGGPAGMCDADLPAQTDRFGFSHQFGDLAVAAKTLQAVVVENRDPRGVITPVFQTLQAFQQRGRHVLTGRCADDSAHQSFLGRFQP